MDKRNDQLAVERRYVAASISPVTVEGRADETPQITGTAAVFYNGKPETEFVLWDGAVERIMPGAFDRAMKEDDVRALFNHDPNQILGRTTADTLSLSADSAGLKYTIDPPTTSPGLNVLASVKRGDVTGSSFSFIATDVVWRTEDSIEIREIRGVELFDVGPVTFPAYGATTADVRQGLRTEHALWRAEMVSEQEADRTRQREKRDRDMGLLLTDAKLRG